MFFEYINKERTSHCLLYAKNVKKCIQPYYSYFNPNSVKYSPLLPLVYRIPVHRDNYKASYWVLSG